MRLCGAWRLDTGWWVVVCTSHASRHNLLVFSFVDPIAIRH